jgi:hypothetical protein
MPPRLMAILVGVGPRADPAVALEAALVAEVEVQDDSKVCLVLVRSSSVLSRFGA